MITDINFINSDPNIYKIENKDRSTFDAIISGVEYIPYKMDTFDLYKSLYVHFIHIVGRKLIENKIGVTHNTSDVIYIRFLQFMELTSNLKSCYRVKNIIIYNYDDPQKAYVSTPISVFDSNTESCKNSLTNVFIPVSLIGGIQAHRNTLIYDPITKNVYLLEPNGTEDNLHIIQLFTNYFSGTKYHFKGTYPNLVNVCYHAGFCNILSILQYFLDISKQDKYQVFRCYFLKYLKWEYKAMFSGNYTVNMFKLLKMFDLKNLKINDTAFSSLDEAMPVIKDIKNTDLFTISFEVSNKYYEIGESFKLYNENCLSYNYFGKKYRN